ncbi:hypothetical protein C8R43DRAFT_1052877 [Mycena crocata]|nr:hypothetical protein C8R43DRAFT_1052877 [Mycena crocata]
MKTQVDELARSWSREDLTTVHNAVLQDPQQETRRFMPAASFTEGTGHRDELGPVAPNKKPLRLLTGIPLSLGKQVQKAAWVYDAVNTIIGVYESAESSAATLPDGSKILCLEMHLGPAVPMPQKKKNDWKVGPATKDLSVERTHEVHANADQHCVLSGSFCFRGQAGHECAHIIPRACDTDALRKFTAEALDREAIAAYLPPPQHASPAPSDGLVTTSPGLRRPPSPPNLLRLHYGVFLAHKFGSLELKSLRWEESGGVGGGGGKDRGGHDSKDNEDENLNTVIRRAPVHA